jgi:hypothetical protein
MKLSVRNLKMMIIASFSVVVVLAFIFADSAILVTHAEIPGAPSRRTGAPGESNCTSCHSSNSATGQATLVAPATYVPGQTYTIQVQNTSSDLSRLSWGFEMTSLTAGGTAAGTYSHPTAFTQTKTGTVNGGVRNYATHTTSGTFPGQSNGSWTFSWTAPATDVGPITHYAAILHGDNGQDDTGDQTYLKTAVSNPGVAVVIHHGFTDFDADGKADPSIYRASNGFWYINRSTAGFTATQWGLATDKLAPADYDGDDKTDVAVWREDVATVAGFYILLSSNNTMRIERFGQTGDDPTIVGDWDGDGKADPAVHRGPGGGPQAYIYFRGSLNNPSGNVTFIPWGASGDKAMRGDFDGDGKMDPAVFRPSNGVWYIAQSSNGTIRYENWGTASDKFVPADYDGDAKTDLAVFRSGVWYIKQSSNSQTAYINWGLGTDAPVPADYDGDGKTDAAVYRNGVWYERLSSSGSLSVVNFGLSTDVAVAGAFVK